MIDIMPRGRLAWRLRPILLGSALGLAMLAAPRVALAQDATPPAPTTGELAADTPAANGNDIIVTARRQEETLQSVPVTVTAIGGPTLEKYNVTQVADVVSRVPTLNVQVGGSGSGGQLSLRGVGSSAISAAFDSAVAFDFDGVQVSTMRLVQSAFVDLKQIDILKGPQSLFFGKSATAGVFSIRSQDPTSTWQAGGKANYEFEEHGYTVNGYVSGPLTPTLGIRLAGEYNDIKDYIRLQADTPAVNRTRGLTNFVARGTLDWKPFSGFEANLKAQYVRNTNDGAIQQADLFCGANGIADPVSLLGGVIIIPAGYDCKSKDGRYFLPDTAPPLAVSVPRPSGAVGYNGVPFGKTDLWFTRLLLNLDLTDKLTLTSTSGFIDLDAQDVDNYSYAGVGPAFSPTGLPVSAIAPALGAINGPGVPLGVGTSDPRNTLRQYSQEVRLTSNFDGMFNFMVGGFYEHRRFGFDTAQNAVNIALIAPDPITGFTFDYKRIHVTKTNAYSVFGSAIINLTDKLELSGGVRYTKEKKVNTITVPYVHAFLSATPAFISSGFFSGPIQFRDNNFSPEVTLKYEFTPRVNVFASYKTGYKSGGIDNSALPTNSLLGFNDPDPAVRAAVASGLIFKSEKARGGEIGLKSELANRTFTFNATAFYYTFKNLQVQNFDPIAIQFITLNAGEVTTKGVDVEMGWRTPVEGLNLSSNLSFLDAKFSKSFQTSPGVDLNGRDASNAPRFSGNLAFDWEVPLSDSLKIGLSGNALYSSSRFTAQTALNDYKQNAFASFDTAISIGHPEGKWKLSLVATDLTDKIWVTTSGGRPFLPGANPFGIPVGDDVILNQNRGRQVFLEASFRF